MQSVSHPKFGKGKILTFYEFYNITFVDVLFDGNPEPVYMQYHSLNVEEVK